MVKSSGTLCVINKFNACFQLLCGNMYIILRMLPVGYFHVATASIMVLVKDHPETESGVPSASGSQKCKT